MIREMISCLILDYFFLTILVKTFETSMTSLYFQVPQIDD